VIRGAFKLSELGISVMEEEGRAEEGEEEAEERRGAEEG
jgi:hypothetical protein